QTAVAEVPDDQAARQRAEAARGGHGHAPGRVELRLLPAARAERALRVVLVHGAESASGHLVLARGVLLRVGDEDVTADRLDPEGRVAARELRIAERARRRDDVERAVEDLDPSVVEVGRVQVVTRDREA